MGVSQLSIWLDDLLSVGLLEFDFSEGSLQELAGRMVDAKLGGIARRIRLLAHLRKSDPSWSRDIIQQLSQLYLFASTFPKVDDLPAPLQQTLLGVAGFAIKKDQLNKDKAITDQWLLAGVTHAQEEQLKVRRCWVVGQHSKRMALLLDFAWGRQDFRNDYRFDKAYTGALVYYPSTFPLRAQLFDAQSQKRSDSVLPAYRSFDSFLHQYAIAIGKNPWLHAFPAAFANVTMTRDGDRFYLVDGQSLQMPVIASSEAHGWSLMAMGLAAPLQVFGEWDGYCLRLLSYVQGNMVYALDPRDDVQTDI